MREFVLTYKVRWKTTQPKADIAVFEPNELSIYPGLQVVVITEPRDYEGLSVTNGSEQIATELMRQHGVGPFGTAYIEHYRDEFPRLNRELKKPSFDAVWYKWQIVDRAGRPGKITASSPKWSFLPYAAYYPVLLERLGEEVPEWLSRAMADEVGEMAITALGKGLPV